MVEENCQLEDLILTRLGLISSCMDDHWWSSRGLILYFNFLFVLKIPADLY